MPSLYLHSKGTGPSVSTLELVYFFGVPSAFQQVQV